MWNPLYVLDSVIKTERMNVVWTLPKGVEYSQYRLHQPPPPCSL